MIRFETEAFQKEIGRVLKDYLALEHTRAAPALLRNRAIQLSVGSGKGAKYKGLFQEARSLRPLVQREIRALPQQLGWKIKRPYGSVKAEIARRLVQAGYYQASGWIVPGFNDITAEGSNVGTIRGKVSIQTSGNRPKITITNTSPRALEFGTRTGYISRAFYNQMQDMLVFMKKHMDLTAAEFSRAYPNFKKPIDAFVPTS